MNALLPLVREFSPDVLIAYPNPPASRVAFGLGIRFIAITDSPHSVIPSRLSLPLADTVIFSSCIPKETIEDYVFRGKTKLVQYNGVDELAWLFRAKPDARYVRTYGLKEWRYVVVRPHEGLATYYRGLSVNVDLKELITGINNLGYDVVVLPRYSSHIKLAHDLKREGFNVRVIEGMYDGVSLTFYAAAVVTGGSTLAREAALLMTPGITYFPRKLHVNDCVARKGYPLISASSVEDILKVIEHEKPRKGKYVDDVYRKLRLDFEDPVETLINVLEQ